MASRFRGLCSKGSGPEPCRRFIHGAWSSLVPAISSSGTGGQSKPARASGRGWALRQTQAMRTTPQHCERETGTPLVARPDSHTSDPRSLPRSRQKHSQRHSFARNSVAPNGRGRSQRRTAWQHSQSRRSRQRGQPSLVFASLPVYTILCFVTDPPRATGEKPLILWKQARLSTTQSSTRRKVSVRSEWL